MIGTIRTKEKCPKCKARFRFNDKIGFFCPSDFTVPKRLFLDLPWQGERIKIYSNKQGEILEGYQQALTLQSIIHTEITERSFDPSKYRREDQQKFWILNLIERFKSENLKSLAPSYQGDYRRMANAAADFFKTKDVREIRKMDLMDYRNHLEARGISQKTVKNYMDHFRAFMIWCKEDVEAILTVPAFPKINYQKKATPWLSKEDQINLFGHAPQEDRPIIDFLALHGPRPGEARALRCRDVNLGLGVITISATFSRNIYREKRKGQESQPYVIAIHPECLSYITDRVSGNLPEAYLFFNPRTGGPYVGNSLRRVWEKVRASAGISKELRLYDATRHSFASQLREAGVDIAEIKDHLGHADIRTTQRYAHKSLKKLRTNLEKLSLKKVIPFSEAKAASVPGVSPDQKKAQNDE